MWNFSTKFWYWNKTQGCHDFGTDSTDIWNPSEVGHYDLVREAFGNMFIENTVTGDNGSVFGVIISMLI